jgi:HEAT repeat protein
MASDGKVKVTCPSCGRGGRVPESALGRDLMCPACGTKHKLWAVPDDDPDDDVPYGVAGTAAAPKTPAPAPVARTVAPASPPKPSTRPSPKPAPASAAPSAAELPPLPRDPWTTTPTNTPKAPTKPKAPAKPRKPEGPPWGLIGAVAGGGFAALLLLGGIVFLLSGRSGKEEAGADTAAAPAAGGQTYSPAGGGFAVTLPSPPKEQIQKEKLPEGGTIDHHIYLASGGRSGEFAVRYFDVDSDIPPENAKVLFDALRDEDVSARKARVVEERDVTLDGHPGRERVEEVAASNGKPVTTKIRTYLVGRRIYQVISARPPGADEAAVAACDRFHDSFRLTSGEPTAVASAPAPAVPASKPRPASTPPRPTSTASRPATVPRGGPEDLRYGWKPGASYVYSVHMVVEVGKLTVSVDGNSTYVVKQAGPDGFTLGHKGRLTTRRKSKDGSPPPGGPDGGTKSAETDLKIDPKGEVLSLNGRLPLGLMGDLSALMIEPFPDGAQASWEDEDDITLSEVETSGGGGAPPALSFGRPNLFDARSRLRGGSRLRSRIAPRPQPQPQPRVKVTNHPAKQKTTYTLVGASGDAVTIRKEYELATVETVDDGPKMRVVGQGQITFDRALGIPRALEFTANMETREPNVTVRFPIKVACRLLEGKDREDALAPPLDVPLTANNAIKGSDVDRTLADLSSPDVNVRKGACQYFYNASPLEDRRADVARALESALEDRDVFLRNDAIRALGVWGDRESVTALVGKLNDESFGSRGELFEALTRLGRRADASLAEAMVPWLSKDAGQAGRILRAMAAAAEPALLKTVEGGGDPRTRVEACRVLKDVGTSRSVEPLRALARAREEGQAGRAAADAIRSINERWPGGVDPARVLADMKSYDAGVRRRTLERLMALGVEGIGREQWVKALEGALADPDGNAQRDALKLLVATAPKEAKDILIARLGDPRFDAFREAIDALARLDPDEASAAAAVKWLDKDRGAVFRAFQVMGPVAQKATISALSHKDWGTRADACNTLAVIGTKTCMPALQKAAMNKQDGFVAGAATNALKALAERRAPDAQLARDIALLKSYDRGPLKDAAQRLANTRPVEKRRAEVARVLEGYLDDKDFFFRQEVLKALSVWGDEKTKAALTAKVGDKSYQAWREAVQVLVKLGPDEAALRAIARRQPDDEGFVGPTLRPFGPAAEKAYDDLLQSGDGDARFRAYACRCLSFIGTPTSLPVLERLAGKAGDEELARVADEALQGIASRPQ